MIRRQLFIINKLGLHARATAKLVATASAHQSKVRIAGKGREVDAKNIMQVMMLAASQGTEVELIADGDDEQQAIIALTELINDYFGEGE
ncbi:HPr family phosphocarrier protein [Marinobacter sp. M3C]|jgi:phosphocarrier protein|uniref:HPr family phosphocarrier protein n=1 Tax=Marinobacter TaxID=2742 RepID=UPI00036D2B9D|nr:MULTISPECIES: HPr family phosphocarrier protein [Marinobacter]MCL1479541.1 HPr family phosphocarrier protein [Marinobacter sp.]MCL1482610.1 HPr family phosphocarrier protein [Marinobacter sp.]MCL1485535.1 HPr family phosphocarrier protein [Marinobacter sp.]MCL1489082.1 HPr family phosphocarrier protein [Marinobacter sp.]UQG54676.1 HPr family phosphocarrier protein [Marinobacter sp. M4C]